MRKGPPSFKVLIASFRLLWLAVFLCWVARGAEVDSPRFGRDIQASMTFESWAPDPSHPIVRLRLVNVSARNIVLMADKIMGVDAVLIDPQGKPVPSVVGSVEMIHGPQAYVLPAGHYLGLIISHTDGLTANENSKGRLFIELADNLWFVPPGAVSSYALRVRFKCSMRFGPLYPPELDEPPVTFEKRRAKERAIRWPSDDGYPATLDLPPQKIVLIPTT
jgi:hypothetical protein